MTPEVANAVGFVQLGWSYGQCAICLEDNVQSNNLTLGFDNPIDYLYAHALELMLKGCLLYHDPSHPVESHGHDLLSLYDEVKSLCVADGMLLSVERAVRNAWKNRLREARDHYARSIGLPSHTSAAGEEFGIYDNRKIGDELPELRHQVAWIGSRNKGNGGQFRYFHPGIDSRPRIEQFGLSDDVVRLTLRWANEGIHGRFDQFWINRENMRRR